MSTSGTAAGGVALEQVRERDREIQLLSHIEAQLRWDQETQLPARGVVERAEQLATLEAIIHQRATDPALGDALDQADAGAQAGGELSVHDRALLREVRRAYEQRVRLPESLVTEIARQSSVNQAAWARAREASDFALFSSELERTVELTLQRVACLEDEGTASPYDVLLDEFEPYMKTAEVVAVFDELRPRLVALLEAIRGASVTIDGAVMMRNYDTATQRSFSDELLAALGFERDRGRLDVSAHPFSTTLGQDDVRVTTRFAENFVASSVFGTIHECGHGLYELGVDAALAASALGGGVSLGIHESQSRFWENAVGRSRAFWEHFLPRLRAHFPQQLADQDVDSFYAAVNRVEPSFIRVEADEVTYNLHILLRFTLEQQLVEGRLAVADLPDAWRAQSRDLLGIDPASAADGVLQDIHWSAFLIGYFPTYTLGNLYGAQLAEALQRDLGELSSLVRQAQFAPILEWLRTHIHRHGATYPARELCQRATGAPLSASHFVDYLEDKYRALYRL